MLCSAGGGSRDGTCTVAGSRSEEPGLRIRKVPAQEYANLVRRSGNSCGRGGYRSAELRLRRYLDATVAEKMGQAEELG